jgi:hypothetical protein
MNMKRNFRILLIASFLVTAPMILLAQQPPHPNGGVNGPGGGPVGGGAPIGSGVALMIALGAAYGARKLYQFRSKKVSITE